MYEFLNKIFHSCGEETKYHFSGIQVHRMWITAGNNLLNTRVIPSFINWSVNPLYKSGMISAQTMHTK